VTTVTPRKQVGLLSGETEALEVFDGIQTGPSIGDVHIHVVLLAFKLINRDAFKNKIILELGLNRTGFEHGIHHPILGHTALDDIDMKVDIA
jgi:hypothetical protein